MEKNTSEGFVFLNSFYEAINEIDDKQVRDEITSAIITFGITENVDFEQLSPVARFGMKIIIPIIEKQKPNIATKKPLVRSVEDQKRAILKNLTKTKSAILKNLTIT